MTDWTMEQARRRLAHVIEQAAEGPQWIYRRNRLVATVIDTETLEKFLDWRERSSRRTPGDAVDELRRIRGDEPPFEASVRTNRPDSFAD